MNKSIYSSRMVCRSSIRPGRASPPPTMEHHAFTPSLALRASHSLSLRSLPLATPILRKLLPFHHHSHPQISHNANTKISPHQIDPFLQHWTTNHVSVYLLLFLITLDLPYILTHIHQPILILEGILSFVNLESENADFCCCDLLAPPPLSLVDFSFYCRSRSRRRSVW